MTDSHRSLQGTFPNAGAGESHFASSLESTFYDWSRGQFVPPDFDVPLGLETSESSSSRSGLSRRAGLRRLDVVDGAHRGDARVSRRLRPKEMTREEKRGDLQRHADDFGTRKGFTYTVLDPVSRDAIGCVCIYPLRDSDNDACALSWVRERDAHLDTPLWHAVSEWLESDWPFASVEYAPRA